MRETNIHSPLQPEQCKGINKWTKHCLLPKGSHASILKTGLLYLVCVCLFSTSLSSRTRVIRWNCFCIHFSERHKLNSNENFYERHWKVSNTIWNGRGKMSQSPKGMFNDWVIPAYTNWCKPFHFMFSSVWLWFQYSLLKQWNSRTKLVAHGVLTCQPCRPSWIKTK